MSKDTLFLINPVSGGRKGVHLKQALDSLFEELGLQESCETAFTAPDGHLPAGNNISDYHRVFIAGGDGTVARILQKLAREEKKPCLGIIPCGTGNDLARISGSYRLYRKKGLKALVAGLLKGTSRKLDVFSVNDGAVLFTNYCGIGLDAAISNAFNRKRETPLLKRVASFAGGRAAYPWFAATNLLYRLPFSLELVCTDKGREPRRVELGPGARQVIVTSIPSYAAGARPSADCSLDDGLFEVTIIETLWQWCLLHVTRFVPLSLPRLLPSIMQLKASELTLRFSGSACFQADGELYDGFPPEGQGLTVKRAAQIEVIFVDR